MTTNKVPSLAHYWAALEDVVPKLALDEQRVALTLYGELAKGSPVSLEQIARALDADTQHARALLERPAIRALAYRDTQGRLLGFGGLATAPMHHTFTVNGRTLWTWCAWDSLFIPELLGHAARVESPDPETGQLVRLTVTPDGLDSADADIGVSFLLPEASAFDSSAANVMATFCHFVFFFASRESAARWTAKHPGTFVYSLDQAVELARRLNAKVFGAELSRRLTRTP